MDNYAVYYVKNYSRSNAKYVHKKVSKNGFKMSIIDLLIRGFGMVQISIYIHIHSRLIYLIGL